MNVGALPSSWRRTTLSEIAAPVPNAIVDGPFGSNLKLSDYVADGVPVLQGKNITNDTFRWFEVRFISESKAADLKRSSVRVGDVLIVKIGSIGYSAIVDDLNGFEFAIIPANLAKVTPDRNKIHLRYLHKWLTSVHVKQYFAAAASKTAQPALSLEKIRNLPIPLPPQAEQRRIADILDRAEALRANRCAALTQLDSLTQSIFLKLFGDPSTTEICHPFHPLDELLERGLQNGAYFPKEAYSEEGIEMVHMSDAFYETVVRGGLKRVVCSRTELEKYSLTDSDILIARRSLNYEGAAKPCLIPKSNEPLIFESSFIRVTPRTDRLIVPYLYHYLNNERVRQKWVRPLVTQSTISGINQSNLSRIRVAVPPLALQHEFARQLAVVEKLKSVQQESLVEMDALFSSLQRRAFRGEL